MVWMAQRPGGRQGANRRRLLPGEDLQRGIPHAQ